LKCETCTKSGYILHEIVYIPNRNLEKQTSTKRAQKKQQDSHQVHTPVSEPTEVQEYITTVAAVI
jgi:hypothetical protein